LVPKLLHPLQIEHDLQGVTVALDVKEEEGFGCLPAADDTATGQDALVFEAILVIRT
jgi:hypothetical protein